MKAEQIFDVRGRVALVTGAASGLGLAYAEALAENGARVTLLDRDAAALEAAVARLKAAGGAAEGARVDVGDREALHRAIDAVAARHGRLDIAFANAGISAGPGIRTAEGQLAAVDPARWDEVLRINLISVFETIRAASAPMKRQRDGRIVATASVAGLKSEHMAGYAYAATKAAVINIVRHAARELAPFNVMVNAIAPGPFLTNIAGGRLHREPEIVAAFAEIVPLGRIADPAEIKGLALLLASPASSFITGTVIPIDGGIMAG
ncbi:MAG TPA: SDR family NAD(P)-dependent oxidoreductase [Stellaceae bacterium]|nr:SDR family NAD(P)-dependent oxidoreductase [Stellaceae bacterium]